LARTFGRIPGVVVKQPFADRRELAKAGVHSPTQAGISGAGAEGADSIVLSGGNEDDSDAGDEIVYTGSGGKDPSTGHQVADQTLDRQNLGLARNRTEGLPVRVSRRPDAESPFAPKTGYDGLFRVEDYWKEKGKSGHRVWRFRLVAAEGPPTEPAHRDEIPPVTKGASQRVAQTILRVVRDTALSKRVKVIHKYRRQVCRVRIESASGPYAEATHIRPLGSPHEGPDITEHLLCLRPNRHVMFQYGLFTIAPDKTLVGLSGRLLSSPQASDR